MERKVTTLERLLEQAHGDLHTVIPRMVAEIGQSATARNLKVSQKFVFDWLRRNGYRQVWIREDQSA